VQKLKELDYRIDADPWLARESKARLLDELDVVLARRAGAMFALMEQVDWDFFQCHIMETDRLHHFLWGEMEAGDPELAPRFYAFYRQLDAIIGRLSGRLDPGTELMICSDHGFCGIRHEVYVNHWLAQQGWLRFKVEKPQSLADMADESVAYSLDPGRIYLNVRGREPNGRVAPGVEYDTLRASIAASALLLKDPATGTPLFQAAFRREELYHGPCLGMAPDLVLQPTDGYDPKGALVRPALLGRDAVLDGMHTFDDALLFLRHHPVLPGPWSVMDCAPTILQLMDLAAPPYMDGRSVI
jgi:predicted AlkP superfamily phosphohydrolase/phosphomutase